MYVLHNSSVLLHRGKWKWNWTLGMAKGPMQESKQLKVWQLRQRCTKWRMNCPAERRAGDLNVISKATSQNGTTTAAKTIYERQNPKNQQVQTTASFSTCSPHLLNAFTCQKHMLRLQERRKRNETLQLSHNNTASWAWCCHHAVNARDGDFSPLK